MGDAVQQCEEFVVPLKALVSIASTLGLRLVRLQQMHALMVQSADDTELLAMREDMKIVGSRSIGRPLSEEEWEAIGVYCVAVFVKE